MENEKQERISNTTAALMIGLALIFDVISALPFLGQAIAEVGSAVVFFIWFLILGLPLLSPKKIAVYIGALVVGVIPLLSALPEITFAIFAFILFTRAEDALGIQVLSTKGLSASPTQLSRIKEELPSQFDRLKKTGVGQTAFDVGPPIRKGRKEIREKRERPPMNDILPPETAQGYA